MSDPDATVPSEAAPAAEVSASELVMPLRWHERLASAVGGRMLDGLMLSCRYRHVDAENHLQFHRQGRPVIWTLWHGTLLPLTFSHRNEGIVTLVSRHRDGEYITRAVRRWGYTAVRGSTSRGGLEALRELIQHVRQGRSLAITPDGPRGPREKMKPGPVLIAQRTGAPIIPAMAVASRAWYVGGWDRFLIPKPMARLTLGYGEPLFVPRRATDAEIHAAMDEVERRLAALRARLEAEPW
ncbi:MAG TPA: lysophospholipid acyltransferase family protein [Longimicrobium sp.]|nr:lysophospholipid acyltransferase family protein [Longimicrobium sp.]